MDVQLALLDARLWFAQKNLDKTRKSLQALLLEYPGDTRVETRIVNAYLGFGDFTNALRLLDSQLTRTPDDPEALNLQSSILIQAGRGTEAIPILDHLLTLTNLPSARLNHAYARLVTTNLAAAAIEYREFELDGAGRGGANGSGLCVGDDVCAGGDEEAEGGHLSCGRVFSKDFDGQEALNGVEAEAGLVAVVGAVPGEDAYLIEVEGQAGFGRRHQGEVLGNHVVGQVGLCIFDGSDRPCADEALTFAILRDLAGDIDVDAAAEDPAGVALIVAGQPPVLVGDGRGCCGHGSGGLFSGGCGRFAGGCGFGLRQSGESLRGRCGFCHRGTDEQLHLAFAGEQIEALGVDSGRDVHVEVVADRGCGSGRIGLVVGGELFEGRVGLGVDDAMFFDPANLVVSGLYAQEALAVFEYGERLAVGDQSRAVGDGRDTIAQIGLLGRDPDGLGFFVAEARASVQNAEAQSQSQQCLERADCARSNWRENEHDLPLISF